MRISKHSRNAWGWQSRCNCAPCVECNVITPTLEIFLSSRLGNCSVHDYPFSRWFPLNSTGAALQHYVSKTDLRKSTADPAFSRKECFFSDRNTCFCFASPNCCDWLEEASVFFFLSHCDNRPIPRSLCFCWHFLKSGRTFLISYENHW